MSKPSADLLIGITSWNSARFIGRCIEAVKKHTVGLNLEIVVFDNGSDDGSAEIAERLGATVRSGQCSQGDALNVLVQTSTAGRVLLLHADVIILDSRWFEICNRHLVDRCVLVSPEDIGCGPLSRPFGRGMPESSFLFFSRKGVESLTRWRWGGRRFLSLPRRGMDFYGPHVTHNLPRELSRLNLAWCPMTVLPSPRVSDPIYTPDWSPKVWSDELQYLRYGLGNFYALDGVVTHYHNWYDRVDQSGAADPRATTERNGDGFPVAFIALATENFLSDLDAGCIVVPPPNKIDREPKAL